MDITTVLLTIQSLLDNQPFHHEPGQENNNTKQNSLYNEVIKYESINTLLLRNIMDPPHSFEIFIEAMKNEQRTYNESILEYLEKNKETPRRNIQVGFYRINITLDYQVLYQKYNSLKI